MIDLILWPLKLVIKLILWPLKLVCYWPEYLCTLTDYWNFKANPAKRKLLERHSDAYRWMDSMTWQYLIAFNITVAVVYYVTK